MRVVTITPRFGASLDEFSLEISGSLEAEALLFEGNWLVHLVPGWMHAPAMGNLLQSIDMFISLSLSPFSLSLYIYICILYIYIYIYIYIRNMCACVRTCVYVVHIY